MTHETGTRRLPVTRQITAAYAHFNIGLLSPLLIDSSSGQQLVNGNTARAIWARRPPGRRASER